MKDSFSSRDTLRVGAREFSYVRLDALGKRGFDLGRLPYAWRVLLENLLRNEDGGAVTKADVETLASMDARKVQEKEIAFMPGRVLMQDFTGVPAVVDLAAMRDAMARLGGEPSRINPLQPVELVIDHSVQVDRFGTADALGENARIEFGRNRERYEFLRWGQRAFENFQVVPPSTGIVHQVNLEHLARVVLVRGAGKSAVAGFDTVVGTDSHTTMINGLGVLGWGVGGIEAEAAMLGQPVTMLVPEVIGVRLVGVLREGTTATDLVLRVTEMLRKRGVVGKFVEFFGAGLSTLPLADRATIANMAPEYGATCGLFPVDAETLRYLALTGRPSEQVALVEAYYRAQGLFHGPDTAEPVYTDVLDLDLSTVVPSLAGPKRPQDRVALGAVKESFRKDLPAMLATGKRKEAPKASGSGGVAVAVAGETATLDHGSVVIAAITSCTNTSNPSVMLAAGLLAQKAVAKGLRTKPWVKTSLAPGSKVVTEYLKASGTLVALEALRFHLVGYGCTTCIGNSGPLPEPVAAAIDEGNLVAAAVLSGNRNFEGRVHAQVRANYLASPPLVVAYALAGRVDVDLETEPLGTGKDGKPVFLRDVWPTRKEVADAIASAVNADQFRASYGDVFTGEEAWRALPVPEGKTFAWNPKSTYVKHPPYFESMTSGGAGLEPAKVTDLRGARVLAVFGDSITTDHISPAGSIKADSPAGKHLLGLGVAKEDFNSYGARRGNHEVMMRGTFANVRIKNAMVPGVEGGVTVHHPSGEQLPIFDAAMKYRAEKVPLVVIAGKEYGSGSSRDWAAKGPMLLGVRAVVAESYERIHRSNLVGMGVLPLELMPGTTVASTGLAGDQVLDVLGLAEGIASGFRSGRALRLFAKRPNGETFEVPVRARIDTPQEVQYFQHGGILPFVLRQLLRSK